MILYFQIFGNIRYSTKQSRRRHLQKWSILDVRVSGQSIKGDFVVLGECRSLLVSAIFLAISSGKVECVASVELTFYC